MLKGAIVALAAGAVMLLLLGRNYSLCHEWYVNGAQAGCQVSDVWHGLGWISIILGFILLTAALVKGIRDKEE